MTARERRERGPSLGGYYAASRFRTDTWQKLKTRTQELAEAPRSARQLIDDTRQLLDTLLPIETYWAYPGEAVVRRMTRLLERDDRLALAHLASFVVRMLMSHAYRWYLDEDAASRWPEQLEDDSALPPHPSLERDERPYFEVLVVDDLPEREEILLRERLAEFRRDEDEFVYGLVVVPSYEDALIASLLNYHIQSCVIRYGFPLESENRLPLVRRMLAETNGAGPVTDDTEVGFALAGAIHSLRPHLDLFLVTDAPVEELAGRSGRLFRRVFYRQEDYRELHLSILKGVRARYETPFFQALRSYTMRPTGVFHALPVSRGKSIARSHWIRDMEEFYGSEVFLAETSATSAGLDSLLQPRGSLKQAQEAAARAFGAQRSFFVTNGTTTANKIVLQALVNPGDIVLVSRDCHQSHHYGLVLCGAMASYLDPYPVDAFGLYGAVPLAAIKRRLLEHRANGTLDRVKALVLTNCTFDGVVYNPERVMEEVLAIHPDIAFIWDEAWFAFAYFTPITRRRTGMEAAARLRKRLRSEEYRRRWGEWRAGFDVENAPDEAVVAERLLPDPERARVRVYVTQSTHKTLTGLRQASMIHVFDEEFERLQAEAFHQAYLTHTSTSANYQILASLDLSRRQVELEGYELVQHAIELALTLRERVNGDGRLAQFFRILTPADLIPAQHRESRFEVYRELDTDWSRMDEAWAKDEFCLDPTRLTLCISGLGIPGDAFKKLLIEEHDIQVNKTSPNTALFMTHIGTTRGATAYLLDVLARIAEERASELAAAPPTRRALHEEIVARLSTGLPAVPGFSRFHEVFRPQPKDPSGDIRAAFVLATEEHSCEFLRLDGSLQQALEKRHELVSGNFVTPYPPGVPVLVPGQVVTRDILELLRSADVHEIHGYEADIGLRLLTEDALARQAAMAGEDR